MGLFSKRSGGGDKADRSVVDAVTLHLEEFLRTHRGVEAFTEEPTPMAKASILLVAFDGEWTRRSVPSTRWARGFAEHHHIPIYDGAVVGYPQRMRDYNKRVRERQA